jgi:hypothetical protein
MRILKELPVFNQRTNKEDPLVYSRSFDRFPLIESEIWVKGQNWFYDFWEPSGKRMMRSSNGLRVEAGLIPVLIMRVTKACYSLHKKNLYGKHFPILQNACQAERPII